MRRSLPTADQVLQAMDAVLHDAAASGQRATVAAVERRLGISHPTFYRHYRDQITEYFHPRATSAVRPAAPAADAATTHIDADKEHRLRQEVTDLRKTISVYAEAIRQLAVENAQLREQLSGTGNVSALRPATDGPGLPKLARTDN